ncbi:MAG: putative arginyl-tRNA--protein transferase [Nitrosomonadaceae bacterium]|nr:arginyltransferase [Nitrosospira sp.]MBI0413775.1 arginyltransferase [Nitrosospira sp.]MCG3771715.1 putative arginyl-tRNA--protein transferase [Nitrosomonadaceae bacterium]
MISRLNNPPPSRLEFYTTASYPCSYLSERVARSEVATPAHLIDMGAYAELVQLGFRRSGSIIYRPNCDHCRACVSVRIIIDEFAPNRNQRRTWKRHHQLTATRHELHYNPHHYELYRRYQEHRHCGGDMDGDSDEQYRHFLLQSNVNSKLVEFHENYQLRMVSIIDELPDGISPVYTFFDPDVEGASFGTHNILWQVQQCRELGLPYLYLGYWIKQSRKMDYKANFQPIQALIDGQWRRLDGSLLGCSESSI